MTSLYPLTLQRRFDNRVWGGSRLGPWMKVEDVPKPLAEVWLVYEDNLVAEGSCKGLSLGQVVHLWQADLVGTRSWERWGAQFPLLAKFLDAEDYLSLQVHPDDRYAHAVEAASGFHGKTEAWYILQAQADAHVLYGWNHPISREICMQALRDESILDLVRKVPVQPHDTVYVPAGTVHAIAPGVCLFEIQQKSDLTYRLYDYGRPRPLQIEQALDVLSYAEAPEPSMPCVKLDDVRSLVMQSPFFVMERWQIQQPWVWQTSAETFDILTVVEGSVVLQTPAFEQVLNCGEAVVLPAALGTYRLTPQSQALILRCGIE